VAGDGKKFPSAVSRIGQSWDVKRVVDAATAWKLRQPQGYSRPLDWLDQDLEMKEFSRLAVGIILLGLAIFLSLDLTNQTPQAAEHQSREAIPGSQPDWQAPPAGAAWLASHPQLEQSLRPPIDPGAVINAMPLKPEQEIAVRPLFDTPRPLSNPWVVGNSRLDAEGQLVPITPRPSFTGTISSSNRLHTIREGDTLQSIAREYFGNAERYLDVYLLNKDVLAHPSQLPAGVEIRIPAL
jgi:nucleoid-associated protein YgaU